MQKQIILVMAGLNGGFVCLLPGPIVQVLLVLCQILLYLRGKNKIGLTMTKGVLMFKTFASYFRKHLCRFDLYTLEF